jgi:hypothetical protein
MRDQFFLYMDPGPKFIWSHTIPGGVLNIDKLFIAGMPKGNQPFRGRIQTKTWCVGPYAGVDYNLTLCQLQSRLQYIY